MHFFMDKVLSILEPLFNYIDGGKLFRQPFRILYYVLGVVFGLGIIYGVTKYTLDTIHYLNGGAYVFAILMILVVIASGVFTIIYWFKRAKLVGVDIPENARFLAIPAISGFVIVFGEWLGLMIGVIGVCFGVLSAILLPITGNGAEFFLTGLLMAVGAAIVGFINILFWRLIGEQILAIGSIANDCAEIRKNTAK